MLFLESVFCFLCALSAAFVCGYGLTLFLLPDRYQDYRIIIAPSVGYTVFSGLSYILSGSLGLTGGHAVRITFAILALLSPFAYYTVRPRLDLRDLIRQFAQGFVLSSTMLVVTLWPLFYVGVTHLGAVNPDYFASFRDNHFLQNASVLERGSLTLDSYSPFFSSIGNLQVSARFASALFAVMLEDIFGFTARNSLTISIAVFLFCLPLTVYFMARVVFAAEVRLARLCSLLTGISGSVTLSFVYFYVGQNSALSVVPLLLTIFYIVLTEPSIRITVLAALVTNSFFFMYFGMLPYACAPAGVLFLYLVWKRRTTLRMVLGTCLVFAACAFLLDIKLSRELGPVLAGWVNLIGPALKGPYFTSFLTEEFFPLFLGMSTYPVPASVAAVVLGRWSSVVLLSISALILVWLVIVSVDWARRTVDKRPVVYVFAAATIYGIVWWTYSFRRQYGYAVFKMATWVQFLLVIMYGIGLYRSWIGARRIRRGLRRLIAVAGCFCLTVIVVGGNLLTTVLYGFQALGGEPTGLGYIVNNFQMSGNYDYFELESALARIVKPTESVGLVFGDSIQNNWVSYYLKDFRLSMLSHHLFPGDDENLPDVITRRTIDYFGNHGTDRNEWFHGASDDYILTVNPEHLNSDILQQRLPKPVWRDRTFQLLRAADIPDFIFTGRGFYRLEIYNSPLPYWWPKRFRWVAEGGEIYLLHRSQQTAPYRLSFAALVGYGIPSARRRLEIWLNSRIVDDVEINGNARVITRPFFPVPGVNLLVVRAKERVRPVPRPFGLWNRNVPEYRALNFGMSYIRLLGPGDTEAAGKPSTDIRGKDIISQAVAFDGIEVNGWVREEARLSYVRSAGTTAVDVDVLVPDALSARRGSCPIQFDADGMSRTFEVTHPGPIRVSLPLRSLTSAAITEIKVKPCKAFYAPGYNHRIRPELLSVQLQEIRFIDAVPENSSNQN